MEYWDDVKANVFVVIIKYLPTVIREMTCWYYNIISFITLHSIFRNVA